MTFVPKVWENAPSVATPIDDDALVDLETRVTDHADDAIAARVFDVRDYGAVLDGVTDDRPAFAAAVVAAAVNGGVVDIPTGTLFLNSSTTGSVGIGWGAFWGGHVTIRGAGKDATKIKLTTNCRTLVGNGNGYASNGSIVYKNLTLQDFTVDCNNVAAASSANFGVVIHLGGRCSLENLTIRRVDTINVGGLVTSGSERRNVDLSCFCTAYTDGPFHFTNLVFEDCYFGKSGGGGNYGILCQALATAQGTGIQQGQATDPGGICNCYMDKIWVNRCTYDSGGSVPGGIEAYSSSGFMFGGLGLGYRLRIRDSHVRSSVDDGFEINSWYDALIDGCTTENCPQEGFYCANLGGMPQPERQVIKFRNCTTIRNDTLGASTSVFGFGARYKRGSPHGTLIYEGCASYGDRSGATKYPPQLFDIVTDFRRLIIKNCTVSGYSYQTWTAGSQSKFSALMRVGNTSGRGIMEIDGLHLDMTYVLDRAGFGGATFFADAIEIDAASDLTIKARNIDPRIRVIQVQAADDPNPSGYTNCRVRGISFAPTGQGNDANYINITFDATTDPTAYLWDTGAPADLTATATGMQVTGTPTAEKRWHGYFGGNTYPGWGPHTDMSVWTAGIVPTSPSLFKLIAGIKGLEGSDRFQPLTRYVEAYITDDATNSFLCVDKVISGTRTSLLGSIGTTPIGATGAITAIASPQSYQSDRGILLASRLAGAANVWVRGGIQGSVLVAEYLSSVPNNADIAGGTIVANTGPITLSAADATIFGDSTQGWPFMGLVATNSTARLVGFNFTRRHVIRGSIENYTFPPHRSTVKNWSVYQMAKDDTLLRLALDLRHDMGRASDSSSIDEYESATATQKNGLRVMPGAITSLGRKVAAISHPSMANGVVLGGNSGASFEVDGGGADYWFEQRTLTANTVITVQNVAPGGIVNLELIQDGTGSRTVTLATPVGGTIGTTAPASAANAKSLVTIYTPDGVNYRVTTVAGL